jgi:gliding motility-associated-like protein
VSNVSIASENTSATVTLTGLHPGPGEDSQTLTVTASSGTLSVLANPSVTLNGDGTATMLLTSITGTAGIVTITIVVRDDGGTDHGGDDETVITFTVIVGDVPDPSSRTAFLPTLFSPNDDGINDVFRVRATGVADIHFCVYSADGFEVFRSTDINEAMETGWNGQYHGQDMPAGTYTWTLRGHFDNGSPLTFEGQAYGQVVLMR